MSAPTFAPTAVRASEAARCARMAALRALGHEPEALHPEASEYLHRGHYFEELVMRRLVAKYGKENVLRQVAIDWGMGEPGHADGFVIPEKALVEVKSTSLPTFSVPMVDMAIAQLTLYLRFYPDAEQGWLMLIDPNRMKPADVITVRLTDEKVAAVDEMVARIRAAIEGGDLPERVCSKPGQARGRLCAFAVPCFEGWEPPAPATMSDPELLRLVAELADTRAEMQPHKDELKRLDAEEKEIRSLLAEQLDEGDTVVGPYFITRTRVRRSPTFQAKLAKAAGFPVTALDEFMRPGAEYDTFKIKPADEAGEIDYGKAPF